MSSDFDLITRSTAGDTDAAEALFRKYHQTAIKTAYGVTRSHDMAEDAAAVLWLWLAEGKWRIDPAAMPADGNATGYVKTLAYYSAIQLRYRKGPIDRRTVENIESPDNDQLSILSRLRSLAPNPEQALLLAELRRQIFRTLYALAPQYQRVAILRYLDELSCADIAALVGVAPDTIPSYLFNIRNKFRAELAGYCHLRSQGTRRARKGYPRFAPRLTEPAHIAGDESPTPQASSTD